MFGTAARAERRHHASGFSQENRFDIYSASHQLKGCNFTILPADEDQKNHNMLYCLVKREKLAANVNAMLFSTGIAP